MKTVGYIRVSSARQAKDGLSLEAQAAKIKAYCEFKNLELVTVISDQGKSGRKSSREGFQQVLSMCEKGEVQAIVVYSLSRFTRSTKDLADFVEKYIVRRGLAFHSLSENLDTSTAMGRAMLKIIGVLGELESELAGERTAEIFSFKRDRHEKPGGACLPFGYDLDPDGKTLIDNPQERRVITKMESLRASGLGYKRIAQELNNDGLLTKTGKSWHQMTVKKTLGRVNAKGY